MFLGETTEHVVFLSWLRNVLESWSLRRPLWARASVLLRAHFSSTVNSAVLCRRIPKLQWNKITIHMGPIASMRLGYGFGLHKE